VIFAAVSAPQWTTALVFLILGCIIGSFLNVCIWRLPRGLSISKPSHSFCPHCEAPIRWHDNIPLLSFALLGGKCRRCRGAISWRYPLVEGLTGVLFAAAYLAHPAAPIGTVIIMALLIALLIVASAIDMEFLIIPDEISLFGLLGGLAAGFMLPELHVGEASHHTFASLTGLWHLDGLLGSGVGAAVGGGLTLVTAVFGSIIFRREAMGIGDAKLMAMVGAFMGWKVAVIGFFVAPLFGLLYGVPLLLLKDEHVMPYGPFLSSASVLVIIFRGAACGFFQQYIDIVRSLFSG